MTETFQTRIPTLSETDLRKYLDCYWQYKAEAVEAAVAELRKRGCEVLDTDLEKIREKLDHRDGGGDAGQRKPGFLHDGTKPRLERIRSIIIAFLVTGLGSAVLIYRLADSAASTAIDLESEDSKKYLRELEYIGGKSNVIASEIRHWFTGLWHGKSLAFTVAWITVILAGAFWFLAVHGRRR
jgi:hypothetical protein